MKRTRASTRLAVTTGGKGVVAHAGARLLCDLADDLGLRPSGCRRPWRRPRSADAAMTGARCWSTWPWPWPTGPRRSAICGCCLISPPSSARWRRCRRRGGPSRRSTTTPSARIAAARAGARRAAWAAGMDPGFYVIDIDGTLVDAHSEKEGAAAELQTGLRLLSPRGLPRRHRRGPGRVAAPGQRRLGHGRTTTSWSSTASLPSCRSTQADRGHRAHRLGAALSHGFVEACAERRRPLRRAATASPPILAQRDRPQCPKDAGRPTISADGTEEREAGQVAEITDLVDLSAWPEGTRMIVRREEPHPGAQLTFTDVDGHRYQVFITDHADRDIASSKPSTGAGDAASAPSATPRTPGSPTCPRPASPSTRPGWPSC